MKKKSTGFVKKLENILGIIIAIVSVLGICVLSIVIMVSMCSDLKDEWCDTSEKNKILKAEEIVEKRLRELYTPFYSDSLTELINKTRHEITEICQVPLSLNGSIFVFNVFEDSASSYIYKSRYRYNERYKPHLMYQYRSNCRVPSFYFSPSFDKHRALSKEDPNYIIILFFKSDRINKLYTKSGKKSVLGYKINARMRIYDMRAQKVSVVQKLFEGGYPYKDFYFGKLPKYASGGFNEEIISSYLLEKLDKK